MPAQIDSMAYVGQVPWHGLGNSLTDGADIDTWRTQAGLDWEAIAAPVHFAIGEEFYVMDDKVVLARSDNHLPLGVVSSNFRVVQPAQILEFYRELTDISGDFSMETAGALFDGRRVWALARSNREAKLSNDDTLRPYLLLATGMDGSFATIGQFTSVRVVCNNTLQVAMQENGSDRVRVTHRGHFDEHQFKQELGLADSAFDRFMGNAEHLASRLVTAKEAQDFFATLFVGENYADEDVEKSRALPDVLHTYAAFPGQDTISARDTAWGLVNGVTAYLDHVRNTHTQDARLNDAWFGTGHKLKARALDLALSL